MGEGSKMIEGIIVKALKKIPDERGIIMHMMRVNDPEFKQFGEIYFSLVNPGVIKGWKQHSKMTQHFAVPVGNIKLVIYDGRKNSSTRGKHEEIFIGENNYQLVCIPMLLWYSFKATGDTYALIANCTDLVHDPEEVVTLPINDKRISYQWEIDS